jgi:hypothetical protein
MLQMKGAILIIRKIVMAIGFMVGLTGPAQAMTSDQVLQAFEAGGEAEGMSPAGRV